MSINETHTNPHISSTKSVDPSAGLFGSLGARGAMRVVSAVAPSSVAASSSHLVEPAAPQRRHGRGTRVRAGLWSGTVAGALSAFLAFPSVAWAVPAMLQPAASGGGGAPSGGGAASPGFGLGNFGMLAVIALTFYFLILRPSNKRRKERDALMKSLDKGMWVRTSGGIRGEIMQVQDHDVLLQVAERVKINVSKTHIERVEEVSA